MPAWSVRVELPELIEAESGTPVGLSEAESPVGEVVVRLIVPLNPFKPDKAIVDVPGDPAWMESEGGLEAMLKSTTFTDIVTECEREPLVPVTVTE